MLLLLICGERDLRFIIGIIALAACGSAEAFDSAKWLAERDDDTDAKRLREEYARTVPKIENAARNVVFPLETYPNGVVKSRLKSEQAYMFPDAGLIWGAGVRVEQYKEDGQVPEGYIKAANCLVDRKTSSGWVDGDALLCWKDVLISGRDVHFSYNREFVKIFKDTKIVTKGIGKEGLKEFTGKPGKAPKMAAKGGAGRTARPLAAAVPKKPKPPAVITAERTDYDRKNGVILLDRRVSLDDSEYQMHADRLFLFLQGTNELHRLVAFGNVAITNGDRRAYCARATYLKKDGRITLFGEGDVRAELREATKKGSAVKGERIVFWSDSDQVQVDRPEIEMPGQGLGGMKEFRKTL